TLLGVLRRQLEDLGAGDPADRDAIVEVDRARMRGVDAGRLIAGLGEDEELRLGADAQRVEDRPEIAAARVPVELETGLPRGQRVVQAADGIVAFARAVGNRRMLARRGERVAPLRDEASDRADCDSEGRCPQNRRRSVHVSMVLHRRWPPNPPGIRLTPSAKATAENAERAEISSRFTSNPPSLRGSPDLREPGTRNREL